MPIHIEIIEKTDKYTHISLAHYGQQNGDAMRDPEMIIALHKESQQFVPYYYRNDYDSTAISGELRTDESNRSRG